MRYYISASGFFRLVLLLIYWSVFFSSAAYSEVIDKANDGFYIKVTTTVDSTSEQAYQKFLQIGQWWDPDHTWFGDAEGLYLEPGAGGCFCEVSGEKSILHLLVSYVNPDNEIRMLGGLGPLQTMGLQGVLTFTFNSAPDNKTQITHEYRVSGYAEGGLEKLADIVDKVQTLQVTRLAAFVKN